VTKKVAIFGDSWAYSSFKKMPNMQEDEDVLTFQILFDDVGITADNYAIPGGSNLDTLQQLKKYKDNYDIHIVFQTDPVRQNFVKDKSRYILDRVELPKATNLDNLCEIQLGNFYQKLNNLDVSVLLIGGCTKLCFERVPKQIKTLPESWTELMVPEFNDHYYYWVDDTIKLFNKANIENKWKLSLSDFFVYEKKILEKNHIWQTSTDFSWCHAAIPAYIKMFNKIMEVI